MPRQIPPNSLEFRYLRPIVSPKITRSSVHAGRRRRGGFPLSLCAD
jgi:hypothetical protein